MVIYIAFCNIKDLNLSDFDRSETVQRTLPAWRLSGFWLALIMALLQAGYAVQAFVDPGALADFRGMSVHDPASISWVYVYGSRTLFVALVVMVLLVRGDLVTLRWVAIVGLVMPLGDSLVALRTEAPVAVLSRHIGTAIYLLVTFGLLTRSTRSERLVTRRN
ncbi:MAG: hypothetical protein K0Q92_304 [Steroidobacteraceae bacterium]|jgi:hypothetical protein|nr:hypothetical protein [Steroidobacteraceae bacterium]